MPHDDSGWKQQVLVGVVMLVAVGVLVGAIVAFLGLKAADVAGLTNNTPTTLAASVQPSGTRTTHPATQAAPAKTAQTRPRGRHGSSSTDSRPTTTHRRTTTHRHNVVPHGAISLSAQPQHARSMQRVNLVGRFPGHDGVNLQVQRLEGGHWSAFPTSAVVYHNSFRTYVETGRPGPNRFRMVDPATHQVSNPVVVMIQ
ncbi:MAG: hypothetical protein ACRDPG_10100 [Nocardioidaceae bacterium]